MFSKLITIRSLSAFVAIPMLLTGCRDNRPSVVTDFDLSRYVGRWYEIARLDVSFTKGCENVTATYTMNDNGTVGVTNACTMPNGKTKMAKGVAKFATPDHKLGALKVSFFRPFYGNYNIRFIAPDYSYAIVTGNGSKYFWLLSRSHEVSQSMMFAMLKNVEGLGFDVAKLHFTKHTLIDENGNEVPAKSSDAKTEFAKTKVTAEQTDMNL